MRTPSVLVVIASLPIATCASAEYGFTKLADSAGPFLSFGPPALNSNGEAVFLASLDNGSSSIYRWSNGAALPIIEVGPPFGQLTSPVISDSGAVAFIQRLDGAAQLMLWQNATLTPVFVASSIGTVSINDASVMVFSATFARRGSPAVLHADSNGVTDVSTPLGFDSATFPSINGIGSIALTGSFANGVSGVYLVHDGKATPIVESRSTPIWPGVPDINEVGDVSFAQQDLDSGVLSIHVCNGSSTTTVVDTSGPFFTFGLVPQISNGSVAFIGMLDGGLTGIFTGPDPVADAVIRVGDALDGSIVTSLSMLLSNVSADGRIGFTAVLANGHVCMFKAEPVTQGCTILGDIDCDGAVGAADLAILLGGWGSCGQCSEDLDGDGVVGAVDLGILLGALQ